MLTRNQANQFFDNVLVSDKGMIKLIRHGGRDYIFPASEIIDIQACVENNNQRSSNTPLFDLAEFFIGKMLDIQPKEQAQKLMIIKNEGYFFVNVLYRDKESSIRSAITKSNEISRKKHGTFR